MATFVLKILCVCPASAESNGPRLLDLGREWNRPLAQRVNAHGLAFVDWIMDFALLLALLLSYSPIGAGGSQGGYHLIWCNHTGIIHHGVDLPEPAKPLSHLFHAVQPLQG